MEGCIFQLLLLLLVGVGLAFWHLKRRIEQGERRQTDLDLELGRLRRLIDDGAAVAGVGPPGSREAALEARAEESAAAPATEDEPEAVAEPSKTGYGPPSTPISVPEPPPPPPPAPPVWERIEWERWIGVRGAAVLGGAVLALAAILFLKFSIERGLIPPPVRVALGVLAGLGAIGGAEILRKRAYGATANALSGAGIVILYASIWAAHRLYDLVPLALAFGLMALVTGVCGLLSWRHRSLVIATLGLLGGFATPFMLATGRTHPIGLFGYVLLLDVGLLVLARQRGWPVLALFSLVGTVLYQSLWIFTQMEADRFFLTLVILAVFALLFAVAAGLQGPTDEERRERRFTLVGGVLLPFAFAAYLAGRADLGEHILPIAVLLLLLSAAACWMARVHELPLLPPGAAAAAVAVVAVWAARTQFTAVTTWEIVGVVSALAALFKLFGGPPGAESRWRNLSDWTRRAPLVAAAGFLLVLLISTLDAGTPHLWPWVVGWLVLGYLLELEAGGAAADDPRRLIAPVTAAAEVATVGIWVAQRQLTAPLAWEVAAVAVALAVFFELIVRQRPGAERSAGNAPRSAPFVVAAGFFLVLSLAPQVAPASGIWPWFAGWVVLAGLLIVRGGAAPDGYRQIVASVIFGIAFLLYYLTRDGFDTPPRAAVFFGLALAVAVALQALALARRRGPVARQAEIAAAVYPALLLLGLLLDASNAYLPSGFFLAVGLLLAGLMALSATRLPSGRLYLGAVAALALVHSFWTMDSGEVLKEPGTPSMALAIQAGAVLLFTFWPFAAGRRLAADRWALYASALAGPLWFLSLRRLFELRFGGGAIGALPVLLAVTTLLAALGARRLWTSTEPERRRSLVWYLAVTFAFVSVAIPLQLEKEWITVGWALEGLALMMLWKRLDHPGLKYLGLALLGAVTGRLILNPAVFGYYPRSGRPIFNWLIYTYLVPVTALLLAARALAGLEIERLLAWEAPFYNVVKRRAVGAISCGLAAILIGFWWINLTVIDYFSVGRELDLSFERLPARDLSLSLSWALYALMLLAVGMARRSVGLRWLSLGFLILTIGKVFLYDLGELRDLYRVASLVGLAVSLLLVSLAYQRFVFGRDRGREEEDEP